ncbi:MAG: FAD-dependent oxidoreductase [Geitlerinemataceae cyanobacterium]
MLQNLVLIGGGHSHAIVLQLWGSNPLPGVRLTLISDTSYAPYSGMLPGYVAGIYTFEECHIDLPRLAKFAGVELVLDRAVGLDLKQNQVLCANHPPIAFDFLSIDIGSTPQASNIPGATQYTIPAKPVPQFLQHWHQLLETAQETPEKPLSLGIIGGGAGGVELALTMQSRLHQIISPQNLTLHLFHRGSELMEGHSAAVRKRLQRILVKRGVQIHLKEAVKAVYPGEDEGVRVECESGLEVECDRSFWVTQAAASPWIAESGLSTDSRGFIVVEDTLQSMSHPQIFAAGDIATMVNHPRPKAGVFAVRQGKPLWQNLQAAVLGKPLKPYIPQKQLLGLIGTGDGKAIASRGSWGFGPTAWLWCWKDRIARAFMERFKY